MTYWLTSQNKKRHQRAINKMVHTMNRNLEQDDLWCGRFVIRQVGSPEWLRYEDGSGAELYVKLKFIDRATGRYYVGRHSVNGWRGLRATGWRIWELMNWLITDHWNVWQEDFARERNYDAWREYNKNTRKV
jgi:hypothetical protein